MKIDIDRMTGGKEILQRYRGSDRGGIPWFVILDGEGKALSTSDGPEGNIGYPVKPEEIAHFVTMLRGSARKMTPEQIGSISDRLREIAAKLEAARRGE